MRKGTCRRLIGRRRKDCPYLALSGIPRLQSCCDRPWPDAASSAYKAMGAVVSIEPTGFTIQTDSGTRLTVLLPDHAILLRVAPNQKDLKNATKISAGDISVGDRILVRGHISDDQKTLLATAAIVMSKVDITRKQEAERARLAEARRGRAGEFRRSRHEHNHDFDGGPRHRQESSDSRFQGHDPAPVRSRTR